MKKLFILSALFLSATCLTAPGAFAQDPVALIMEGGTADGLPDGHVISSIGNPSANHSGGWAFGINSVYAGVTLSSYWGNSTGGPGSLIRTEGTYAPYEQTAFESFWGLGAADAIGYSPTCININDGTTGLDGVWMGDTPVAVEEMVFPYLDGYWWSFGSRPGVTEDGVPYFVGGITATQGGSTSMRGLFYGMDATPVIMGGDALPGLPANVQDNGGISFDYRFSAYGNHYIAEVTMDTGATNDNTAIVVDGAGLMIDGMLVQEGHPVPAAAGGLAGENWSGFDFCGITEDGSYMFTGDTSGDTATDEFVVINGMIVLREGMMLGEYTLSGSIEGGFMNQDGDYAVVWDVDLPTGENVEALIFNGEVVLLEGSYIDTDGDGIPQPDATVSNFTGISAVVVSDRNDAEVVTVLFTADVTVPDAAQGSVAGTLMPADETLGMDEDYLVEGDTRAVVEFGYAMTFGGVVSALLSDFDAQVANTGVEISWHLSGNSDADRLNLTARSNGQSWDVPFQSQVGGRYTALDNAAVGGEVIYSLLITGADGEPRVLGEKAVRLETPSAAVQLQGAFPNPFNPETKITFRLGAAQNIQLAVYDLSGRLVNVLADEAFTAGVHQVAWDGRDQSGAAVPSGTYFARAIGEHGVQTAKLMLVK